MCWRDPYYILLYQVKLKKYLLNNSFYELFLKNYELTKSLKMKHLFNLWPLHGLELQITNLLNKWIIYGWLILVFRNKIGKWKAGVEAESKKLFNLIRMNSFLFFFCSLTLHKKSIFLWIIIVFCKSKNPNFSLSGCFKLKLFFFHKPYTTSYRFITSINLLLHYIIRNNCTFYKK